MKKALVVLIILLGSLSSGLFFSAGKSFYETGADLKFLRSKGGESVAEVYYQHMGLYGIAYSRVADALGVGTLMFSLGFAGIIFTARDKAELKGN
jgi:hypothetical protein